MDNTKDKKNNTEYYSDSSDEEQRQERLNKLIPAHIRIKEAILNKKLERQKGTKKEKINYDE